MNSFIDVLLHRLLTTSVQTALLAALVWLLCRHVSRLSPATQCWLWWLVALQALLGLFASRVELPWLPQMPAAVPQVASAAQWTALPVEDIVLAPLAAEYTRPWWPDIALALWMAGLAAMAWTIACRWRHGRRLLRHSAPCADPQLLQTLARAVMAGGCFRMPQLRLSDDINSPLLIGPLRPVLLLPSTTSLDSEEMEMALAHELAHLRRGDLWWGWIPSLARLLFFFHPLAHLAVREYGIAREAACDAAVVEAAHRSRRDYGRLLLRLGTTAHPGHGLAAASPTFNALKRRLTMLQHTTFLSRAGSFALLAVVAAGVMPLRLVAATTAAPPKVAAAAAAQPQQRSAVPRTAAPPAASPGVVAPATAEQPARNESAATETLPSVTEALQNLVPQPINATRFDPVAAFLNAQLRETERKRTAALQAAPGASQQAARSQSPAVGKYLQLLMRSQATQSQQRRALQPATRPRYQALFTQYEAECQAQAEQWSKLGAQGALDKATCLEQAEQRAYREASTAEQAAEKEALVEQRRRAAMGLPPVDPAMPQ